MKMLRKIRHNLFLIGFLITFTQSFSQDTNKSISYDSLKVELAKFFVKKKTILNLDEYYSNKSLIKLSGVYNNYQENFLIDGVYSFSINRTHHRAYFVIIDDGEYFILDIDSKEGLIEAIKILLDFAEKERYCQKIISDYTNRLLGVYYNINKDPYSRRDVNCLAGVFDTNKLP